MFRFDKFDVPIVGLYAGYNLNLLAKSSNIKEKLNQFQNIDELTKGKMMDICANKTKHLERIKIKNTRIFVRNDKEQKLSSHEIFPNSNLRQGFSIYDSDTCSTVCFVDQQNTVHKIRLEISNTWIQKKLVMQKKGKSNFYYKINSEQVQIIGKLGYDIANNQFYLIAEVISCDCQDFVTEDKKQLWKIKKNAMISFLLAAGAKILKDQIRPHL